MEIYSRNEDILFSEFDKTLDWQPTATESKRPDWSTWTMAEWGWNAHLSLTDSITFDMYTDLMVAHGGNNDWIFSFYRKFAL